MSNPSRDMSFLDHLEELRWHIIRSTISVLLVAIVAFLAKDIIFDQIIFGPKKGDFISYQVFCSISQSFGGDAFCFEELPFRVQSRTVSGQFSAHLWTSILAGFILAFPYVVYEFWKFISPGLYKKEKEGARGFIFISSTLFFIGMNVSCGNKDVKLSTKNPDLNLFNPFSSDTNKFDVSVSNKDRVV